jgi:hypothetical protein
LLSGLAGKDQIDLLDILILEIFAISFFKIPEKIKKT